MPKNYFSLGGDTVFDLKYDLDRKDSFLNSKKKIDILRSIETLIWLSCPYPTLGHSNTGWIRNENLLAQ